MTYIPGNYVIVDGELYHHGTKGMRWGIRRFQYKDGSLTPEGKKRYSDGSSDPISALRKRFHNKKVQKKRQDALAKARAAKAEKKQTEEELAAKKQKVRDSHDAKTVYENKDLFSDKELQEIFIRLNTEKNIKNLIPEEKSKFDAFVDNYSKTSKTIKQLTDSSDDIYKSYEKGMKLIDAISKTKAVKK